MLLAHCLQFSVDPANQGATYSLVGLCDRHAPLQQRPVVRRQVRVGVVKGDVLGRGEKGVFESMVVDGCGDLGPDFPVLYSWRARPA